jgi:hypothetical protein
LERRQLERPRLERRHPCRQKLIQNQGEEETSLNLLALE